MSIRPHRIERAAFENFLLAHHERHTGVVQVQSRPFMLLLDPASTCQLQCPMCPTGLENARQMPEGRKRYRRRTLLGRELFDAVLAELGDTLFFVHLYNWGEPLLNRDLTYFISALAERGIATDTNTNLSLQLSDEAIDALVRSGIDRIEASIDGFSQESYGRYRIKGRFELARDNLVRLARARDRLGSPLEVVWNYLVFRFNEHEIEQARAFCAAHGIEFVRREASLSPELRDEFLPTYREGEALGGFNERCAEPFVPAEIEARSAGSCAWHYWYSVVNADGSVSPCCAPWEDDWDMGMVSAGGTAFGEVWNNGLFQHARADVAGHRLLEQLRGAGKLAAVQTVGDFVRQGTICEGCQMPLPMLELFSYRADAVVEHFATQAAHLYPDLAPLFGTVRSNPAAFSRSYAARMSPEALPAGAGGASWKKRLPIWLRQVVGGARRQG